MSLHEMDDSLREVKTKVFDKCSLEISNFKIEQESQEYDACRFILSGRNIVSRSAKITPKKVGQFVTFWKRIGDGPIEPFSESDPVDFYVVNARIQASFGQFVFPKSVLIKKGIISTKGKEGKRAFRVYPSWDIAKNQQAIRTQKWQLEYFYEITDSTDHGKVLALYKT